VLLALVSGMHDVRGLPVLIVEDDPASARLMSVVLATEGCDVRVAASAEQGLDILHAFPVRVIVLDLVLPRMSGLLFARQLKEVPATRDIVIIAVTFMSGADAERVILEAGCDSYLRKPIDTVNLVRTVARAVRADS